MDKKELNDEGIDLSNLDLISFRDFSENLVIFYMLILGIPLSIYIAVFYLCMHINIVLAVLSLFTVSPYLHYQYLLWLERRIQGVPSLIYKIIKRFKK